MTREARMLPSEMEETVRRTMWNTLVLTAALALTFVGARATAAPQPGIQGQSEQASPKEASQSVSIYKVSYKVNEVENGRMINSRSYTLMAQTGKTMSVRIGNRVPYATNGNNIQYSSVGMNIDSTIDDLGENLLVHTKLEMNTLAAKEPGSSLSHPPVFNDLRLVDATSAAIGKPAFVGSLDDVASNRRYVIEVTVTKAD